MKQVNKRRTVDDELYVHFLTFSVYRRRRLLDHDHLQRILLGVLNAQLEKLQAKCIGFVIMPNHVHALVWFPARGQLVTFVHEWKRLASFAIRAWYRENAPHYTAEFGEGDRFWQPKYYALALYSADKIEKKLAYMPLNPVRAGLVSQAIDWKWSSARWYASGRTVGVRIEWVE